MVYPLDDFLKDCAATVAQSGAAASTWPVRLVGASQADAAKDLGLPTAREAIAFLAALTPGDFTAENLGAKLEKNPFGVDVLIDAYCFVCLKKNAYLAFYKNPKTSVWNVKSLKLNSNSPLTHSPFAALLSKKEPP